MLVDSLSQSIKSMKQMDKVENAVHDAQKKEKNDSDYKGLVDEFSNTINKLHQTVKLLDYNVSEEILKCLEEGLNKIDDILTSGVVDEDILISARQHINKKLIPNLSKEWKMFYQEKTKPVISKLNTFGYLVGSPDMISNIRTNITNGSEWSDLSLTDDGLHSRLALLKESIDKVDEIENNLNFSDKIKTFIVKVTGKTAKVSDINEEIIEWIKNEGLDDKFIICFKN